MENSIFEVLKFQSVQINEKPYPDFFYHTLTRQNMSTTRIDKTPTTTFRGIQPNVPGKSRIRVWSGRCAKIFIEIRLKVVGGFWTSVHQQIRKNEVPLKQNLRSMRSFFLQNYLNRSYSEALLTTSKLACLCGTTPFLCRRHILSCESMIEKIWV